MAFSPAFLYCVIMKKTHLICLLLVFGSLLGAFDLTVENMMNELAYLSIPADREHISVTPGFTYSPAFSGFSLLNVTIPFAGNYYMTGTAGAGHDIYEPGILTLITVGLGYRDIFPNITDLYYDLGVSYRNIKSGTYNSDILSFEFLVEQRIQKVFLGVGIDMRVQDYEIVDSNVFSDASDRLFKAMIKVQLRSPLGNIELKGMPDTWVASVSWTLRLDE